MTYTREQILNITEGVELNVLVQKHVFGSEVFEIPAGWAYKTDDSWLFIPNYSSSIFAVWEVVKYLNGNNSFTLKRLGNYFYDDPDYGWEAQFTSFEHNKVTAITAPEAICKSALLAVKEL